MTGITYGTYTSDQVDKVAAKTIAHGTDGSIGFYGTAPITRRSGSTQATSVVSGVSTGAVSTNSLVLAALLEIMSTLTALGLWKGGA